jgi:hypothetical protein
MDFKASCMSYAAYMSAWLLGATVAFLLAFAAPTESRVMGHLPTFFSHNLKQQPIALPQGLPSDRTLALITFKHGQRPQVDGWVNWAKSLNQAVPDAVNWMRVTVVNDPGTDRSRGEVWTRLLEKYPDDAKRANLVPVFTDHASFVRASGASGTDPMMAVVLNRQGDVLARAEGPFDADKAQSLLETLKSTAF